MMKAHVPIIQVKVLVNNKPAQEYHKDGLTFVEGCEDQSFELLVRNLSGKNILVHPMIDGLSVMSGEEASEYDNNGGYVLHACSSITIPGWRLDNSKAAQFFFAGGGESYAEKVGKGKNKGVIACPVWEERVHIFRGATCSGGPSNVTYGASCGASLNSSHRETRCSIESSSTCNLGAGFGEATTHEVQSVAFTAATDKPLVTAIIYYDNREGLGARGIKLLRKENDHDLPNPFPKDEVTGCTPPHGWEE